MAHKKYLAEYVLVFPTSVLYELGYFQGLCYDVDKYVKTIIQKSHFMMRKDAEFNAKFKQIIPYIIVSHNDTVFSYRRGKLLSEKRLLNNYSIGLGGHISGEDIHLYEDKYTVGMKRELNEEVDIRSTYSEKLVAMINEDSTDVGKVHFGMVHVLKLNKPGVKKKEMSINDAMFRTLEEIRASMQKYENWSRICIADSQNLLKDQRDRLG